MMDRNQRIALLQQIDLFRFFDASELSRFADSLEELEIAPGAVLCAEGAPGQDMFILLEGALQIYKDKRAITTIHPIDYIGEMAIIEEKPRSATVIATTPAKLLRITQAQFREYLSSQPPSLVSLMQTLSQRIRKDTVQLAKEYEQANILIHDMRNAMSAFLLLELLAGDSWSEGQRRYLDLMRKSRQDVATMMEEALANAKRLHYPKWVEVNSLNAILTAIPETLSCHPDLKDKIITVRTEPIPDFAFNRLDIDRVVTNLVINAGQASPPGGTIEITASFAHGQATVEVTDHGAGVPAEIRGRIFEPQFTTKPDGNGLGLASCREIIARYAGTVSCLDHEGGGATFRFTLPVAAPGHE